MLLVNLRILKKKFSYLRVFRISLTYLLNSKLIYLKKENTRFLQIALFIAANAINLIRQTFKI
jgi:hypothetical protein